MMFEIKESAKTGLEFSNIIKEDPNRSYYSFNQIYNGGGVSAGDFNNDGLVDLFFTGNEVENKIYLNKGDLKFEDITTKSGISENAGWHNGSSVVDINGDGFLDIYICRGGAVSNPDDRSNLLYINNGDLTFSEKASEYGLDDKGYSFQSCFFDYDNDGDLDLYVINHPDKSFLKIDEYKEGERKGSWMCKDHLYKNEGGKYLDATFEAKIGLNYAFGLSLICSDFNGDHFDDIYVCNDYTQKDYLWVNQGDGTFKEAVDEFTKHISLFSMGSDFADINNDGKEDLFVSEMLPSDYKRSKTMMADMNPQRFEKIVNSGMHYQYMHNMLQLNQGDGLFSEISQFSGISKTDWSWASFLSDFDNDGLRDLFVSNGYLRDVYDKDSAKKRQEYLDKTSGRILDTEDFFSLTPQTKVSNTIFRNEGELKFADRTVDWGFDKPSFSNGATIADLDNDGDIDIVVNNMEDPVFLYENQADRLGNNYLRIKLNGHKGNPSGLGAMVTVSVSGEEMVFRHKTNRGYLSTTEDVIHFGLGKRDNVDFIKVKWYDNTETTVRNPAINQQLNIAYAEGEPINREGGDKIKMFEAAEGIFPHTIKHQENEHDDFKYQVLLPHRLSRMGPFISIADVNGDGMDDFFIGGAKDQEAGLYVQTKAGKFKEMPVEAFKDDRKYEDLESVFYDADGDGDQDLYVVSGGTEWTVGDPHYIDRLYINDGTGQFSKAENSITPFKTSGQSVSATDFNKDGLVDLFVGGRTLPDYYPNIPNSHLLLNYQGKMADVTDKVAPSLRKIGMISSSVWSDINKDGWDDLIIVGEWMPIRIFINNNGVLSEKTNEYGLAETTGWWNKIYADDLDGDGDQDFVIGNLGRNYKFHASEDKPFKIYSNDFDQNGTWDIVLAKKLGNKEVPIRGRQCTSEQMPFVAEKYPSYNAFAEASVDQIVDLTKEYTLTLEAKQFASIILWNDGNTFRIEELPVEAQLSSINAILVHDFDADGNKEIILAGNNFQSEVETTRADASYSLVLELTKNGRYELKGPDETGLVLDFEVKDLERITVGDQTYLLVSGNNERLRSYQYKTNVNGGYN